MGPSNRSGWVARIADYSRAAGVGPGVHAAFPILSLCVHHSSEGRQLVTSISLRRVSLTAL